MFYNFKDAFINKPQFNAQPPKIILEFLNQKLPNDFKYFYDDKTDLFLLHPPKDTLNLIPERIEFPKNIDKNIFLKNGKIDLDAIKKYSYNSQTPIKIIPGEDGCYIINGERIKATDLIKNPLKESPHKETFITLNPPKFPEPQYIKISGNGHELNLKIQRKAINSIDTILLETIDDSIFHLTYWLNIKDGKFNYSFNIFGDINDNTKVEDIVKYNYIFNACVDGNALIDDMHIESIKTKCEDRISDETIEFWNKIYELEKFFGLRFNPNSDISIGEGKVLYELYRCFIEKKPFKRFKKFKYFKGKPNFKDNSKINKIIGDEISIEFDKLEELKVFGQTLKYYSLIMLNRAKVTSISFKDNNNKESIVEVDDPDDGKMFVYQMDFLTKEELNSFRNREDYVSILEKAEEIDYLEG